MESKSLEVAKKMNMAISSVLSRKAEGFEEAFVMSSAMAQIRNALTPEYMAPIMELQGSRLGFKTDLDHKGGKYPVEVVKQCLMEAVLMGLKPVGNHWNIIKNNMYPTKEGLGYKLNSIEGLSHSIIVEIKSINAVNKSAIVEATIEWTIGGKTSEKKVPIPLKNDDYTTVDAMIGKGTRKARAWLLSAILGTEIMDGDASESGQTQDINYEEVVPRAESVSKSLNAIASKPAPAPAPVPAPAPAPKVTTIPVTPIPVVKDKDALPETDGNDDLM